MNDLAFLGPPLPKAWRIGFIADVTSKVGSGSTPRGGAAVYVESGTSFIRSQNVYDHEFRTDGLAHISDDAAYQLRGVTVEPSDVLLNITGDSILRTCVVPPSVLPARVSQHVAIIRSNGQVAPGFLQKWLSFPVMKDFMLGHSSGGTRKAVTKGHILSFPIPLPPLAEQRGITATLEALDDKIECNRRTIDLASQLLDALSKSAATDLPTTPLADLARSVRQTVDPARLGEALVDHYSLPAFDDGVWPERVRAESIMSNKLVVDRTSILISRLNPRFNRTWWAAPDADVPALASTEFSCLTAGTHADLAGLWLAVRDTRFRDELARRVTGTSGSHQRIRPDDMLTVDVPDTRRLADAVKQQALALLQVIHLRRREVVRLAALRNTLLPELLSGRIRVPEAAAVAEVGA